MELVGAEAAALGVRTARAQRDVEEEDAMYKRIAAGRTRKVFADLAAGNDADVMKDMADHVHHVFPGDNALGGERHSRQAFGRWLERVRRLIPELDFEVQEVAVKGPPWDMMIAVKWTDHGRAADGVPYENRGAHWIRIKRGKGVAVNAYLDTDKVTAACERMAAAGIEEAAAPPIVD
jgi:ketosteroid isomerase-like protein